MSEIESARKPQQPQTYTVQRLMQLAKVETWVGDDGLDSEKIGETYGAWVDVATVTVPPRAKRSVVIKQALADAGIKPTGEALHVRVLDVDSAAVHEPKVRQVAPEWVL